MRNLNALELSILGHHMDDIIEENGQIDPRTQIETFGKVIEEAQNIKEEIFSHEGEGKKRTD